MSFSELRNPDSNGTCTGNVNLDLFLHMSLIPSFVIMVILYTLQKRVNRMKIDDRIPLKGRFGIVIPLDFIGSFSNRWTFGFAFGAIANKIMSLFSAKLTPFQVPSWANAVGLLLAGLEVGFSYYPIFACLSTRSTIVGSILGFLYTSCWFIVTTLHIVSCSFEEAGEFQEIIICWPSLLCLVMLLAQFIHMFIKGVRVHLGLEEGSTTEELVLLHHQADHVKRLLRKSSLGHEKSWFQRKVYAWDPYFRFPSRMVFTSVLTLLCLYIFVVLEFRLFNYAFQIMNDLTTNLGDIVASANETAMFEGAVAELKRFTVILQDVWFISTFTSIISSVTYVFHILVCYRKHMKRLWVGTKNFLPERYHSFPPDKNVAAIASYSGWQIAYVLWGYQIIHVVQFLIGMAFMYMLVVPIIDGQAVELLKGLGFSIVAITLVILLAQLQHTIALIFFLQPKISPEDQKKPLALNNRRAFHTFSYFFFFYNVILGLSACLFRLFCSFFLGTWLIARIDRTILQRGYEGADLGYQTWIGMLFVDHYHTNPVLVSFCQILLSRKIGTTLRETSMTKFFRHSADPRISSRARTRWFLMYTLLKNPKLIMMRKDTEYDESSVSGSALQHRTIQGSVLTAERKQKQARPIDVGGELLSEDGQRLTDASSVACLICPDLDGPNI